MLARLFLGTAALGLVLAAAPASAQYYDSDAPAYDSHAERVIVIAPEERREHSAIGAPIRTDVLQREVRFDDLDLTTDWGARELYQRVRYTASTLCRRLDQMHPIAADDNPPCYRTALDDAMGQADEAIEEARGGE